MAAAGAAGVGGLGAGRAIAAETTTTTPDMVKILPSDPRYSEVTVGNNARWVAHPESVRLVHNTSQVVKVVQEAVTAGKRVSIRGGGHCYADFVYNSSVQLIIDMSMMNQVTYDSARSAFCVEAGATLLDAYEKLYKDWGVGIPGGMCYSVGVGGHVAGGGFGLLARQFGLTVDHLYAVEVVTVDASKTARVVVATRAKDDPHRELWWAHTGGGGGNFGVVTRYWFRSPEATGSVPADQLMRPPKEVFLNAVSLPWSSLDKTAFTTLLRNYGTWLEKNSAPDSPYAALSCLLLLNHRSNNSIGLLTQIDASVPDAETLLKNCVSAITAGVGVSTQPLTVPVGEQGPMPEFYHPRRLPWLTSVRYLGTNNPMLTNPTLRGANKSAYLRKGFSDAQIGALHQHLTRTDVQNPTGNVILFSYGGKVSSVAPDATASAQRDSIFKALYSILWTDAGEDDVNVGWLRDIYRDTFAATGGYPVPNASTDGCYINYQDGDITDTGQNTSGVPWSTLYYKDHYPRLQKVKAAYDPGNFFRHPQSIALP